MKNYIDILLELKELAPTLASLERQNPFAVPEGYFQNLESAALERGLAADELAEMAPKLSSMEKLRPFSVSDNFFGELHESVMLRATNRLEDDVPSTSINEITAQQAQVFTVPEGYFNTLHQNILNSLKDVEEDIELATIQTDQITRKEALSVPTGFFDQLHSNIMSKVKDLAEDDEVATTQLDVIAAQTKEAFTVPTGYFNQLHDSIMNSVSELENTAATTDISSPQIDAIANAKGFDVPDGYFNGLHDRIMGEVREMMLQEEPTTAVIDAITSKGSGFTVPAGYFAQLQQDITTQVAPEKGKVIQMEGAPASPEQGEEPSGRRTLRIVRTMMAIAAMLALFVFGPQLINQNKGTTDPGLANNDGNGGKKIVGMGLQKHIMTIEEVKKEAANISFQDYLAYMSEDPDFGDLLAEADIGDEMTKDVNLGLKFDDATIQEFGLDEMDIEDMEDFF